MNLLELIKKRSSVRQYASTPVEDEKLNYLLETARLAPSAVNFQPWHFIIVREAEGRNRIRACYPREWFTTASCYIIVCADHSMSWKRGSDGKDHADIDAAIVSEHIMLAATEQGLGACWVCNFDATLCKTNFNIPEHVEPVVLIPIGYPIQLPQDEEPPKKRKALHEIIRRERF